MRQTFTIAVGASLVGAELPDGSYPAAVMVDNPSSYWYQVWPGASWIAPNTSGNVTTVDGSSSVDVRAMATGPAGQTSLAQGDKPTITLYDAAEAPPESGGDPYAWFTPGQSTLRFLGNFQQGATQTITVLPTERALIAIAPITTPNSSAGYGMTVTGHTTAASVFQRVGYNSLSNIVVPIIPGIELQWDVTLSGAYGTAPWFMFASTQWPVVELSRGGPQIGNDSLSVVLATDQAAKGDALTAGVTPFGAYIASQSAPNTWDRWAEPAGNDSQTYSGKGSVVPWLLNPATGLYDRQRSALQTRVTGLQQNGASASTVQVNLGAGASTLVSFRIGAALRGSSLGASIGEVDFAIGDGTHSYELWGGMVIQGTSPIAVAHAWPIPNIPVSLTQGVQWVLKCQMGALVGTPSFDVICYVDYI